MTSSGSNPSWSWAAGWLWSRGRQSIVGDLMPADRSISDRSNWTWLRLTRPHLRPLRLGWLQPGQPFVALEKPQAALAAGLVSRVLQLLENQPRKIAARRRNEGVAR